MNSRLIRAALAAMLVLAAPAAGASTAQSGQMPVATFLAKTDALKAKGMMAMFSPDVSVLKAEVTASAQAFRRQVKAEAAAGKPSACLPEHGSFGTDDLINHMRSYPAADRARIPVSQAVADLLRKRYPCPAR